MKKIVCFILFFGNIIYGQEMVKVLLRMDTFFGIDGVSNGNYNGERYYDINISSINEPLTNIGGVYGNFNFVSNINSLNQTNYHIIEIDKSKFPLKVYISMSGSILIPNPIGNYELILCESIMIRNINLNYEPNNNQFPFYYTDDISVSNSGQGSYCLENSNFSSSILTLTQPTTLEQGNCNSFSIPEQYAFITQNPRTSNLSNKIEYRFNANEPWQEYTPLITQTTFTFQDLGILPTYIGNFEYRVKFVNSDNNFNNNNNSDYLYTTSAIYEVKGCAPALVGSPVIENLKCFDSENGSIKLKFDRTIAPTERVVFTLFKRDDISGIDNSFRNIYVYPVGASIPNGIIGVYIDQNNEFTIPNLIRGNFPDLYRFNYKSEFIDPITGVLTDSKVSDLPDARFNITSPSKVEFTVVKEEILCHGAFGKITINATGGTGNYRYSIDNGTTWFSNNIFSNLPANQTLISGSPNQIISVPYEVLVKDINGGADCIAPALKQEVTFIQPQKLEFFEDSNTGITDPKSYKSTDGKIVVKIRGGLLNTTNPNYTVTAVTVTDNVTNITTDVTSNFPQLNLNNTNNAITLSGLSGKKEYAITVKDANNCVITYSRKITAPNKIQITFPDSTQINCFGETATVKGKITGGKPRNEMPYFEVTYNSSNGTTGNLSVANTSGEYTFTLPPQSAGTYSFSAQDGNGIFSDFNDLTPINDPYNYTIINKPDIVFNPSVQSTVNQICFGDSIIINPISVSGGTGALTYQWFKDPISPTNNGDLISGANNLISPSVLPGFYRLEVTDGNSCKKVKDFTINAASQINLNSLQVVNITDPGTATGKITGNVTGATGGYVYELIRTDLATPQTITPAPTSLPIINLLAGSYTLNVKSATCVESKTFTIAQPPAFVITTAQNNGIDCNGNTATITVNVTGGTPRTTAPTPYLFSWTEDNYGIINSNQSNNGTTSTITTIVGYGNYKVTVTDGNGIVRTATFTIANPTPITAIANQTNVTCFGLANGAITIAPSGGNITYNGTAVAYTYLWEKKNNFGNYNPYPGTTATLTGLTAGDYRGTVSNTLGCASVQVLVAITQPTALTATTSVYPVTNTTTLDGSITVTASGGTLPYQCQINTNGFVSITAINGQYTFSNLGINGGNSYLITVKDANNCQVTTSQIVTTITPIVSSITRSNAISCFNGANGELTATISGGRTPYTYKKWYKIIGGVETEIANNIQIINNLSAGNYKFVARDSNVPIGETISLFTLTQPTDIVLQTNVTSNVKCLNGSDGAVSISFSGGTPNYNLKVTKTPNTIVFNGIVTNSPTAINSLSAGNYTIELKDSNNCIKTASFTITQPATVVSVALSAPGGIIPVTQFGASTGAININVSGGTTPYTYDWFKINGNGIGITTGITTQNLIGASAGTYYVVVKDANLCTIPLGNTTITQPLAALTTTFTETKPDCFGELGSITANSSGGTGQNYSYIWIKVNDPLMTTIGSSQTLSNIPAGNYSVTITDSVGINIVRTVSLGQPPVLAATIATTSLSCGSTVSTGSITVTPSGGTSPYSYTWLDSAAAITNTRQNLGVGSYNLVLTDAKGCSNAFTGITISINGGIDLNAVITNASCNGESDGSIILNPTRNNVAIPASQYSFAMTGNTTPSITSLNTSNRAAGTYAGIITITNPIDNSTCAIPLSYTITQPQAIVLNEDAVLNLCNNQAATYNITNAIDGATYLWSCTSPKVGFPSTSPIATLSSSGVYKAKVTLPNGCYKEKTITVNQNNSVSIDAKFLIATQTYTNEEIILVNVSSDPVSQFTWIFPDGVQVIQQTNDIAVVKMTTQGVYKIKLKAINASGCEVIDEKEVFIETNPNPNGVLSSSGILIKQFIVSPNPMLSSQLQNLNVLIELATILPIEVSVFSLANGNRIFSQISNANTVHDLNFNMASLASGTYFVLLTTPGSIQAKKLIKQ